MVKGVADTNVYISALNFGGIADEVLALAKTKVIVLFISPPILKEIGDVLIRKFNWSPQRVQAALTAIEAFTELVHPTEKLDVIQDDEPDNRILECALAAQVDFVVSGDKHLQKLRTFRGVTILSPRELLEAKGWL